MENTKRGELRVAGGAERLLSPSLLASDFSDLAGAVKYIEAHGGSLVHIDVMDGHFVPPVSFGQPVITSLRRLTSLPFDVHLMIERPEDSIPSFISSGADFVTFHIEATHHADRCIQLIRSGGARPGIALCPATPVLSVHEILHAADIVLVMTVNPGWGGQRLIPYTVEKVRQLADIRSKENLKYLISVDGGINRQTLRTVLDAGTDIVVSGSAFFKGELGWNQ